MNQFNREKALIGQERFDKIKKSKIILFGVGGVGGFVAEFLVRAGVENLTIVDFDIIDETNLNRQIIALESTVGKTKVDVLKNRLIEINSSATINSVAKKITTENILEFNLDKYSYVIDCIDDIKAIFNLIKYCYQNNIKCISALGAGNKFSVPNYVVCDIFKTEYDAIGKKLRKYCRENCIKKYNVVYSKVESVKVQDVIGSISYHPPACASVLSGFVINEIIKEL